MADEFNVWEQGNSIAKDKYLDNISYNDEGLTITLKSINENDPILKVTFKTHFSFRNTNESFRINSIYNDKFQNGINYSTDTQYLRWIKEETHSIYNEAGLVHYLICSNDDITDVISSSAPVLTLVYST
ncbi:hypothetical protein ACRQ5D_19520 [Mucilaginibacter sp. P25]|uniref:Uncharacterized protein n=1 Tax=Mucilaginibacter gossypii TaxID=551996 RepID=A0A1G8E921_9SPHI|nr:hypothetical protein [Mucilaginibacter gossypii]SDH66169.1 hypothetical protein SAMN05192573_111145 [Mucilaginibacter gossypii]